MITGPKYKIARRLNAPVFEKTQTPKYALSLTRKQKGDKGRPKAKTNFGRQPMKNKKLDIPMVSMTDNSVSM